MCHESLCHIKNNVPHIYRKYYLKKFSRLVSSKSAELTSKILSCEGRDLLLQLQLYRQLCPTQERIFEVNSADFEDTNLENFFTEYLLYMCGTLFLMWQCDSWHMTHLNDQWLIFFLDMGDVKLILLPTGPLRVRSQNRVHWQYSTILAQTYSFNSDCLASRCDLNLIKDSFGNLWNTGIECKQSLSHKLKKFDQNFVKIPIFPINLLKYCQYSSFWLLTLSALLAIILT